MPPSTHRLALGLALAVLVTALLAGTVATTAAIAVELGDGDTCETGGTAYVKPTPSAENVETLSRHVAACVVEADDPDAVTGGPPTGTD